MDHACTRKELSPEPQSQTRGTVFLRTLVQTDRYALIGTQGRSCNICKPRAEESRVFRDTLCSIIYICIYLYYLTRSNVMSESVSRIYNIIG